MSLALDQAVYCSPFAPVLSLDELAATPDGDDGPGFDVPAPFVPHEDRLAARDTVRAVHSFVDQLPGRHREIVRRIFWGGQTQAAVARDLGVSGAAVSKTLAKVSTSGRRRLAAFKQCHLVETA